MGLSEVTLGQVGIGRRDGVGREVRDVVWVKREKEGGIGRRRKRDEKR